MPLYGIMQMTPRHEITLGLFEILCKKMGRGCSAVVAYWTQDSKIPGSNPVSFRLPHWGR